jgi:uncharacterized membrane protein
MSTSEAQEPVPVELEPDPRTEAFLAGAYRRIQAAILVMAAAFAAPLFYFLGWRMGGGFLLGAAIAYLNFLWLKQSILALTDSVNEHTPPTRNRAVVFKFIFRYAVIGAVAYAIISSSSLSVLGLMAGFFLSVAALLFEAVTEVVQALRHGG